MLIINIRTTKRECTYLYYDADYSLSSARLTVILYLIDFRRPITAIIEAATTIIDSLFRERELVVVISDSRKLITSDEYGYNDDGISQRTL
jgi:hypothetical protein